MKNEKQTNKRKCLHDSTNKIMAAAKLNYYFKVFIHHYHDHN